MSDVEKQRGDDTGAVTARDGIALIVVLGMLALMVLMGVTFSIYMRTERVAAGNYRNDVNVRQLVHVALNRALQDIEDGVSTNIYPPWDVLFSTNGSVSVSGAMAGSVMNWIPLAALGTNTNPNVRWIELPNNTVSGRVAYVVVNCSGLLDANYAGGQARAAGATASEIQVGTLPEVASLSALTNARVFETTEELNRRGVPGALRGPSQSLTVFSAFPTNGLVDISGSAAQLVVPAKRAEIIAGFVSAGLSAAQAGILFTNLVDYVDADLKPGNLGVAASPGIMEGPFVEPVPMFNEVYITNQITFTPIATNPGSYLVTGRITPRFECIYPFPSGTDRSGYTFNYRIAFTNVAPSTMFAPAGGIIQGTRPLTVLAAPQEYWAPLIPATFIAGGTVNAAPSGNITMQVLVSAWITHGSDVVDATTNSPLTMNLSCPVTLQGANYVAGGTVDRECRDPRMNWNGGNNWLAADLTISVHTMNAMNTRANMELNLANPATPGWQGRDGDTVMHVANQPLQTVGELGNLFLGSRFETVRLYKHGNLGNVGLMHPVLDVFTVDHPSGRAAKGKVNPNTRQEDVLYAVYTNMPINFPHGDGTTRLTGGLLDTMVTAITSAGGFTRLSDLGRVDWTGIHTGSGVVSDLDKESFIRNVTGLFGVRQNFFVILLYAQSTKNVMGLAEPSVVAEARAIAEIWRDPQDYSYFVRTFKFVNE